MIETSPPTDYNKLRNDVVFNGSPAAVNTWQDLDLSAYVGAQSALCFLAISYSNPGPCIFAAKTKGYSGTEVDLLAAQGCNVIHINPTNVGYQGYIIVVTNNAGIIEIATDDITWGWTIRLVGSVR